MNRVVYSSVSKAKWSELINPLVVFRTLLKQRELIAIYTKREFQVAHRGTVLGVAWTVMSPLIMLAIYAVVFGFIFKMRFNLEVEETKLDFALALFVGLSLYNFIAHSISSSCTLMASNAAFVKTLSFPVQILPMAAVFNALINLGISFVIIGVLYFISHGFVYWTSIFLVPILFCFILAGLGLAWIVAAIGVFLRDLPAIIQPLLAILMMLSAIFFPAEAVPAKLQILIYLNPMALLVEEARGCVMYGEIPNFQLLGLMMVLALALFVVGYAVFTRLKGAFADVL